MRKRAGIPVYSAVYPAKIVQRISIGAAHENIDSGAMVPIYSGKRHMRELVAVRINGILRDDRPSPCAITAGEIRANAGLNGQSVTESLTVQQQRELSEGGYTVVARESRRGRLKVKKYRVINGPDFVEQAHGKVTFWPVLGDTKAVRVVPSTAMEHAFALMAAGHEG